MGPGDARGAGASGLDGASATAGAAGPVGVGAEPSSGLFRASVILLVLAPLCSVMGWAGFLFVLGQQAVPGWAVGGVLFLTAMVLLKVDSSRRRSSITFRGRNRRNRWPWFVTLPAVVSVLFSGLGALDDVSSAKYHVLSPANSDGCRVAVREVSFLFAGSGTVYVVNAAGIGWKVSSWTADDGYEPVSSRNYELKWHSDGGSLLLHSNGDPVWPGLHEINCPAAP